jgi:hypothetical protein
MQAEPSRPQMAAAPVSTAPPVFTPGPAAAVSQERRGIGGWFRGLKTWKKIALGIVVFIVLVVMLAMWATSGLDEPVERHFSALHSGDVVVAYSELSVAARQQTSLDDFKKMLVGVPALTKVTGQSFSSREVKNGEGHLEGYLELEGGGKLPIEVRLVKENDAWKIFAYHVTGEKKTSE